MAIVQTLINVIGEVTLDSLGKIEAAEAAYNKLSEERKAYVTNHQTLIDARAAYDRLKEETDKEQAVSGSGSWRNENDRRDWRSNVGESAQD